MKTPWQLIASALPRGSAPDVGILRRCEQEKLLTADEVQLLATWSPTSDESKRIESARQLMVVASNPSQATANEKTAELSRLLSGEPAFDALWKLALAHLEAKNPAIAVNLTSAPTRADLRPARGTNPAADAGMVFDEVHLFIDETGDIANPGKEPDRPLLVGGMVIFGNYDVAADDALRKKLREVVQALGGNFPSDLHLGVARLAGSKIMAMIREMANWLPTWAAGKMEAHGIHVHYRQDFASGRFGLPSETERDHRYVRMLLYLIEYFLFAVESCAARLKPGGVFHLNVANRPYKFDQNSTLGAVLKAQGYLVEPDKKYPGYLVVKNMLLSRELLVHVETMLHNRWPRAGLRIGSVGVWPIDYCGPGSLAAMYLADWHLSHVSRQMSKKRSTPVVGTLNAVEYGPWLDPHLNMKAALDGGDLATLRAAYLQFGDVSVKPNEYAAQVNDLLRQFAQRRPIPQPRLEALVEAACRDVDQPGGIARGEQGLDFARALMQGSDAEMLRARALEVQGRLSAANHRGNTNRASEIFAEYESQIEPRLPTLLSDGIRLMTEIRNRRAVSLMDQFEFEEAEKVLSKEIDAGKDKIQEFAKKWNRDPKELPNKELGGCLGSLGQVYAFLGGDVRRKAAESCFRTALKLFTDPRDRERQWVYLGHLACDNKDASLWREVTMSLADVGNREAVWTRNCQFILALQVKGLLTFGTAADRLAFLGKWPDDPAGVRRQIDPEHEKYHPFGLIYQDVGLLYTQCFSETHDNADRLCAVRWLDHAEAHLRKGKEILQVLARVTRLRRFSLIDQMTPADEGAIAENLLDDMKRIVVSNFGDVAWRQDADRRPSGRFGQFDLGPRHTGRDRAKSVVAAFRFNFW